MTSSVRKEGVRWDGVRRDRTDRRGGARRPPTAVAIVVVVVIVVNYGGGSVGAEN